VCTCGASAPLNDTSFDGRDGYATAYFRHARRPPGDDWSGGTTTHRPYHLCDRKGERLFRGRRKAQAHDRPSTPAQHHGQPGGLRAVRPLRGGLAQALVGAGRRLGANTRRRGRSAARNRSAGRPVRAVPARTPRRPGGCNFDRAHDWVVASVARRTLPNKPCRLRQNRSVSEQRKVVTILFADVVGSTETASQRDPEVVRSMMSRYFMRVGEISGAYGGTGVKLAGDAVVAGFGVPAGHAVGP